MTRIIAGQLKGRRLATPDGDRTRPTSDRVREALFGALEATLDLDGVRFLDLYAGSGAVGLEAFSRGAAWVTFMESHAGAARVVRRNLDAFDLKGRADVVTAKLPGALDTPPQQPYDVVFADPPYDVDDAKLEATLSRLTQGWLDADAEVIVERRARSGAPPWPAKLTQARSRAYGDTVLWYGHVS